ncbi:hypothetical protein CIW48_19105 [Methylobacterium sp. P1-11]|uniref:hypothetical protein n=1 Tax=Methylobacterium sp. P1-11 TaxID=2024616 RepID=UPI0011ED3CE0|nr:hypothetical protein [Methylobacterium sp. P1-11]KAA0122367.1 hypothetical protein CIW48_19105 [Methylobacterium sp. P1-11]
MKEGVMVQPRLTGLEFSWFTKCQMMASNYAQHWEMVLEPDLGSLVQAVASDARTSFTGPQSMRRVAERLTLAADAIAAASDEQAQDADVRREGARCTAALQYLASQLESTATGVEAWKHLSASASETDQVPSA